MIARSLRQAVTVMFVTLACLAARIDAQQSHVYAGGTIARVHQTQGETDAVGGSTWGGSVVFGVQLSSRVSIEVEPLFGGAYSQEYTYRPGPSRTADVVASRRDTFFPVQLRTRLGVMEPVVGVSYVHSKLERHATSFGRPYFDDARTDGNVAIVGGLDAAIEVGPRVFLVPTFRMLIVWRPDERRDGFYDPLGADTNTGAIAFRYGVGARMAF